MLLGALANTIPDLDVLLILGDPIREITIHRGFSHSFVFPFLAAPVPGENARLPFGAHRAHRNNRLFGYYRAYRQAITAIFCYWHFLVNLFYTLFAFACVVIDCHPFTIN